MNLNKLTLWTYFTQLKTFTFSSVSEWKTKSGLTWFYQERRNSLLLAEISVIIIPVTDYFSAFKSWTFTSPGKQIDFVSKVAQNSDAVKISTQIR